MPAREELAQGKTITLNRIVSREKGEGKNVKRFNQYRICTITSTQLRMGGN